MTIQQFKDLKVGDRVRINLHPELNPAHPNVNGVVNMLRPLTYPDELMQIRVKFHKEFQRYNVMTDQLWFNHKELDLITE